MNSKSTDTMELLKDLYKVYSPSGSERKMKKFIYRWVAQNLAGCVVKVKTDNAGNLYITRGKADTYPCVVAHLDQVQKWHSRDFRAELAGDIIVGYSMDNRRQEGLGADDKNGIWVALNCLKKYAVMKVALFVQEEVGCVGSNKADMHFFKNCRYVLQCDRRNGGDLITDVWGQMCSDEFLLATNYQAFGYKEAHGMMTDVATLRSNGLKVSAVNISCGYYAPHTDEEFTVWSELQNCLAFVENIIENCLDVYPYEEPKPLWWDDFSGAYGYGSYKRKGISKKSNSQHFTMLDELSAVIQMEVEANGYRPIELTKFRSWYPEFDDWSDKDVMEQIEACSLPSPKDGDDFLW